MQQATREKYDFSQGKRRKYARRCAAGTNVVVLDPDVAKVFFNSKVVNRSLRKIIRRQNTRMGELIKHCSFESLRDLRIPFVGMIQSVVGPESLRGEEALRSVPELKNICIAK